MSFFIPHRLSTAISLSLSVCGFTSLSLCASEITASTPHSVGEYLMALDASKSHWLSVGERSGIQVHGEGQQLLAQWQRPTEFLDSRSLTIKGKTKTFFASFDNRLNQVLLYSYDDQAEEITQDYVSAPIPFPVEGLCLHKDADSRLHLFLLSERFEAHQYLLQNTPDALWQMHDIRTLPIGPETEFCAVDDQSNTLFVSEAEQTLWAFSTLPEAEIKRTLVELAAPYGTLGNGPLGLSAVNGRLYAVSSDGPTIHTIDINIDDYTAAEPLRLNTYDIDSVETISTIMHQGQTLHSLYDENKQRFTVLEQTSTSNTQSAERLPEVKAFIETDPMPQFGDAADDPALWIHPNDSSLSLVIGTNKRQGLFAYNLQGNEVQRLDVGRVNNVDIRYGMNIDGRTMDIAVASNRDLNALSVFSIDRQTHALNLVATIPTPLQDIYGLCMYQDVTGQMFTFVNDADGSYLHYALHSAQGTVTGELLRQFKVDSQPEGCVANDHSGELFIGEEDVGIWTLSADARASTTLTSVAKVGEELHDDVEGLALYLLEDKAILIASSQGNDSYVLIEANPPYKTLGAFRIGMNIESHIDGASETDGLEVSSANLGGAFHNGILIVQDGRNVFPQQPQNFKLVPWQDIESLFTKLEP
ncbi:MAG: phytase [Gammaproteobacteria bacterium]